MLASSVSKGFCEFTKEREIGGAARRNNFIDSSLQRGLPSRRAGQVKLTKRNKSCRNSGIAFGNSELENIFASDISCDRAQPPPRKQQSDCQSYCNGAVSPQPSDASVPVRLHDKTNFELLPRDQKGGLAPAVQPIIGEAEGGRREVKAIP